MFFLLVIIGLDVRPQLPTFSKYELWVWEPHLVLCLLGESSMVGVRSPRMYRRSNARRKETCIQGGVGGIPK